MKAIILAAGKGTRLKKYTKSQPKGMLQFSNKTLIQRQIDIYRDFGINDIIIITGYKSEKINYHNVKYYHNENYNSTNMLESFILARDEFDDDIIVSYADIIFEKNVLMKLIESKSKLVVTVDLNWKKYWIERYDTFKYDLEGLKIDSKGYIIDIGDPNPIINDIDGRYIGLVKFKKNILKKINSIYDTNRSLHWNKPWGKSKNIFQKAYFTDLIYMIIKENIRVSSLKISGGWLEFDTNQDYERMNNLYKKDSLNHLIELDN